MKTGKIDRGRAGRTASARLSPAVGVTMRAATMLAVAALALLAACAGSAAPAGTPGSVSTHINGEAGWSVRVGGGR